MLLKADAKISELGICVNFNEHIEAPVRLLYLNATTEFIDDYNKNTDDLELQACAAKQKNKLTIEVENTRFIEPDKQLLYLIISGLGVWYPMSGGGFGFVWFGLNSSDVQIKVSDDIALNNEPVFRHFSSWPYFSGSEAVKSKHMKQYQQFMFKLINELRNRG